MPDKEAVMAALGRCYDPCCRDRGISVVDMGLIEAVDVQGGEVRIQMVLTTGWCPFVANLNGIMTEEVRKIEGVEKVDVAVVWDPVWTMDRLSDTARAKLTLPLEPLLPYREARLRREEEARAH